MSDFVGRENDLVIDEIIAHALIVLICGIRTVFGLVSETDFGYVRRDRVGIKCPEGQIKTY